MKSVQIVTSALNEEGNLPELFLRLQKVFESEPSYSFEVFVFDNSSSDGTWDCIEEISVVDKRFKGFLMSRKFSLDASLTAGIDIANADAVITMASDLQDEPEKIHQFLRAWENGHDLVLARIKTRPDLNMAFRIFTPIYYKLAYWASDGLLPQNVSDFRLMSRVVYENLRKLQEQHRYMRGLTAWTGFSPTFIDMDRAPRFSGKSNNNFFHVLALAGRGILAQSTKPISLVSFFGLIFPIVFFALFICFASIWFIKGVPFAGFGSIISAFLMFFSINFFILGVLAQYISLIYLEAKKRPHYIIRKRT